MWFSSHANWWYELEFRWNEGQEEKCTCTPFSYIHMGISWQSNHLGTCAGILPLSMHRRCTSVSVQLDADNTIIHVIRYNKDMEKWLLCCRGGNGGSLLHPERIVASCIVSVSFVCVIKGCMSIWTKRCMAWSMRTIGRAWIKPNSVSSIRFTS